MAWVLLVLGLAVACGGCGGGGGGTKPDPVAPRATAEGWEHFEAGDYEDASESFGRALESDSLYTEAWCGLGWTRLRLGERESARTSLEACLSLDEDDRDARVALAVVLSSLGEKESCVAACVDALEALGDEYEFEHDTEVTSADLRVLLAESYFQLLELDLALEQVRLLDPTVDLDPSDPETWGESPTFDAALLAKIEELALLYGT
jgi:tetratricopeptide (TPR) repeat protein